MKFLLLVILAVSLTSCFLIPPDIPPPVLIFENDSLRFDPIISNKRIVIKPKFEGEGTLFYTVDVDHSWLKVSQSTDYKYTNKDSIVLEVNVDSKDLRSGENLTFLRIKSIANETVFKNFDFVVSGSYTPTQLSVSTLSESTGTIKESVQRFVTVKKTGHEAVNYTFKSDKDWLQIVKLTGLKSNIDTLWYRITIDKFPMGAFEGNLLFSQTIQGKSLPDQSIKISGNFDPSISGTITGHTLQKDEYWKDNVYLTGDITIPKGRTLTILPGTKVVLTKNSKNSIYVNGNFIAKGSLSNIIELKSESNNPTQTAWGGIVISGDYQLSHVYIRDAHNAFNFENLSSQTQVPLFENVFIDNCLVGLFGYKSTYTTSLKKVSFRKVEISGVHIMGTSNSPSLTIEDSEFLDNKSYICITLAGSFSSLKLSNVNFPSKENSSIAHIEVLDRQIGNDVFASSCHNLTELVRFGTNNNIIQVSAPASRANSGVGCGFVGRY
ncbi:MAG: BACON domain-containing protein [Leadbetterella sp.]